MLWSSVAIAQNVIKKCKTCGKPITQCRYKGRHVATSAATPLPHQKKINIQATKIVDLGLPSGTKWAGWNLGACSPEQFGNYYSWGETSSAFPDEDAVNQNYKYKDNHLKILNIAGTQYDAATASWGNRWRMPTERQIDELRNKCRWKWMSYRGIIGYAVTGPNGKSIFLPACHGEYGKLKNVGTDGYYWYADVNLPPNKVSYDFAFYLVFLKGVVNACGTSRACAYSIRPVYK